MKRLAVLSVLLVAFSVPSAHAGPPTEGPEPPSNFDGDAAIVQLTGEPLATSPRTRPPHGKKVDFSSQAVKAERARLRSIRNDYKAWLHDNAPRARVVGEFDLAVHAVSVQLNGEELGVVGAAPHVVHAEYQALYQPNSHDDPDLDLIDALSAWSSGPNPPERAGEGVKVAVIDSGIDVTHPCFSDTGYPPQSKVGTPTLTNNKVVAAKVFNMQSRVRGLTPADFNGHGTHVAGTIGCNLHTDAVIDGIVVPYDVSGVAPRALLGNYNVFPKDVFGARSEDILDALEAAYEDGFDVANMSLGGNSSGIQDLLTIAVDNLDRANMVLAISAGNSGPENFTIGSPGMAARAITAGASTVGHTLASPISVGTESFLGVLGEFGAGPYIGTLRVLPGPSNGLELACGPLAGSPLPGTDDVALISRGSCTFSTKLRNLQAAGAEAAIVVNQLDGPAFAMAQDGTPDQPTIPGYMLTKDDGLALLDNDGQPAILGSEQYVDTDEDDILASFSSWGPTDVANRVKPDVLAPGFNVLSAQPVSACEIPPCWAFFSGTSMAAPHLAGSAAVLRWLHPEWTSWQVRSAIANTAEEGAVVHFETGDPIHDVLIQGAGRENLGDAAAAAVALDPVSVSFGAVPGASGQTRSASLVVSDIAGSGGTVALAVDSSATGVAFSVSPSSVDLAPGESATVTVTLATDRPAAAGSRQAWLRVSKGGVEVAHAALFVLMT